MIYYGNYSPTARQYEIARTIYSTTGRSPQWCKNISKAHCGKIMPRDGVEKMRKKLTGRKLTKEHKQHIAAASKIRGMSVNCRLGRLRTLEKQFTITYPNGTTLIITNLKQFCIDKGIPYNTAKTNSQTQTPVIRGPLMGYNFKSHLVDYNED